MLRRLRFWIAVLGILGTFVCLVFLGVWQLERKSWKDGLNETLLERSRMPPLEVHGALAGREAEFLRIRLHAVPVSAFVFHLRRPNAAGEPGRAIFRPYRLADGTMTVVEEGWVSASVSPISAVFPAEGSDSRGKEAVSGRLRKGGFGGPLWLRPSHDLSKRDLAWIDLAGMMGSLELAHREASSGFYLESERALAERGVSLHATFSDPHLGYALTWFCLAAGLAVLVGFGAYRRRRHMHDLEK